MHLGIPDTLMAVSTPLMHMHIQDGVQTEGTILPNTMALLNTVLLIGSGVLGTSGLQASSTRAHLLYCIGIMGTILLATAFLSIQSIEYMHLYWCISTSIGQRYLITA